MGEQKICILSIDGGGIRGIIPAVILAKLEEILQRDILQRNEGRGRIMDYFDVIAGTSTGGLIAAMLTTSYAKRDATNTQTTSNGECSGGPYSAQEIQEFYERQSKEIFPPTSCSKVDDTIKFFRALWGPKYDGENLRSIVFEKLGTKKLGDIFEGVDVVIPTFDIMLLQPKIFSSFEARSEVSNDKVPLIADVCIATTAAPTYLPAHHFEVDKLEYNLIDGGVVANNPTLVAIAETLKAKKMSFATINCENLVVLSLGTGSSQQSPKYSAKDVSKWGLLSWVSKDGSSPIIDAFSQASDDLVDFFLSRIFEADKDHADHYLRIQADVPNELNSMDQATNITRLREFGKALLDKPLSRINLETGLYQPVSPTVSNIVALEKFAELLVFKDRSNVQASTSNTTPESDRNTTMEVRDSEDIRESEDAMSQGSIQRVNNLKAHVDELEAKNKEAKRLCAEAEKHLEEMKSELSKIEAKLHKTTVDA